ncbi:hypothetical protein D3C84_408030 [compost metagenome]
MYHVVLEHDVAQGIDQRLQLYAAGTDPLRQRRTWYGQAGTTEDFLLPMPGQAITGVPYGGLQTQCRSFYLIACRRRATNRR